MDTDSLHSSKQVKIPTPRFVVFYNGTEKQPEIRVLRLSDAYERLTAEPEWEFAAAVERAVGECIEENILKQLLTKYRSEAIAECIFEFDEEKYKK